MLRKALHLLCDTHQRFAKVIKTKVRAVGMKNNILSLIDNKIAGTTRYNLQHKILCIGKSKG